MILKCTSFEEMSREITERNQSIIIFGAGVIGTVTVPAILRQYHLLQRVLFYADNNRRQQEVKMIFSDWTVEIKSVEELENIKSNAVIIMAVSRYAEVLNQLEQMTCTEDMICYLMPMMCIHNFCNGTSRGAPLLEDRALIPKRIHYMWLGRKQIPANLQKCIDSWKKYCPDYEIIQWNEDNYDIAKHKYMQEAYENKAYGFVPDYARLDILYRHGGIYVDTDVEIKKSLDPLLKQEAFCGVEKWQVINFGGCSGAVKGNRMVKKFLENRENICYLDKDGKQNMTTCGFYDTEAAIKNGYQLNGMTQNVQGMNIYAYDYFHPYDYMSGISHTTEHTYSVHWFHGGWLDEKMKSANEEAVTRYERIYSSAVKNT